MRVVLPYGKRSNANSTDYNTLSIDFEEDSFTLNETDYKEIEKEILELMLEKPNIRVEIASHTYEKVAPSDNKDLS